MGIVRVALLKMTPCGEDQAANQSKGEQFCRRAREMGADIALFPEMWNIGYAFRRPGSYGPLTSPDVREPFIRPDARR